MSLWDIGDIHGCVQALDSVIEAARPKKTDTVILLGDYIDRGPDSQAVIERLIRMKNSGYKIVTLRGNHEVMMLKARSNLQIMSSWLNYGGDETLDSYGVGSGYQWQNKIPEKHWQFLSQTQAWYETDKFIFVHAGLTPGIDLLKQNEEILYWKHQTSPKAYRAGKTIVCGHTSQNNGKIANFGHTLLIDTFIHGGQWLSCLNVDSGEYWQANKNGDIRFQEI